MCEYINSCINTLEDLNKSLSQLSVDIGKEVIIHFEYSGYGDSGDVFDLGVTLGDEVGNTDLFIMAAKKHSQIKDAEQLNDALHHLVSTLSPGYEINAGGYGSFTITGHPDPNKDTTLFYESYYNTSETLTETIAPKKTTLKELSESQRRLYSIDLQEKYKSRSGSLRVDLSYAGSGDSGDYLSIVNSETGVTENDLDEIAYRILQNEHPGYELNSGGEGNFSIAIDFDTGELTYSGETISFYEESYMDKAINNEPFKEIIAQIAGRNRKDGHSASRFKA